jgi:ABC-type branched-subunit amino acid transport system permease subunit
LNVNVSMQVLLMAIVGGVRKTLGPVIGASLLLLLVSQLPAAETQGMVFGGALVLILLVAPQGLIGAKLSSLWRRQGDQKLSVREDSRKAPLVAVNAGESS